MTKALVICILFDGSRKTADENGSICASNSHEEGTVFEIQKNAFLVFVFARHRVTWASS